MRETGANDGRGRRRSPRPSRRTHRMSLMPRYRFQIALRGEVIEDHEGIELAHRAAAIEHAIVAMREMLAEDIRQGCVDLTMRIEIIEGCGATVHVADCAAAMAAGTMPARRRA